MEYFQYREEEPVEDEFANFMQEKLKERILAFSSGLIMNAGFIESNPKEK